MIGVFDSGVGGLTVVREIFRKLPHAPLIYFGDTARTPYGTKSPETVTKYGLEDVEILRKAGATVIVIACNTVSSVATETIRKHFPDLPVFDVVSPAVKRALAVSQSRRIGVIGTRATVGSGVYERLLKAADASVTVVSKACPLLVPLVEEGWIDAPETTRIVRRYIHPLKADSIDTLILACTHYPFLKPTIQQKMGRRVALVDSAEAVVETLIEFVKTRPDLKASEDPKHRFLFSDITDNGRRIVRTWLGREVELERVEVS